MGGRGRSQRRRGGSKRERRRLFRRRFASHLWGAGSRSGSPFQVKIRIRIRIKVKRGIRILRTYSTFWMTFQFYYKVKKSYISEKNGSTVDKSEDNETRECWQPCWQARMHFCLWGQERSDWSASKLSYNLWFFQTVFPAQQKHSSWTEKTRFFSPGHSVPRHFSDIMPHTRWFWYPLRR